MRTFGCVRVVWNRTLAARNARYATQRKSTSYAQTNRALTAMKKDPALTFLNEVSSVPLQQTLRHQQAAFGAFFAKRARHPRFKSRRARQSATFPRSAFTLRGGQLRLAKTTTPLRFVWSWPDMDVTSLVPTSVTVGDIAREAQVSDGALYNYFEDKEDLLAHALFAHVGSVMGSTPPMPRPGTGTVAGNLRQFIDSGLDLLVRVTPAFAGLLSQPKVLTRFRAMAGGDEAFGAAGTDPAGDDKPGESAVGESAGGQSPADGADEPRGLPDMLGAYLRAEQRLGRIDAGADVDAATTLVIGAMHGQILPRMLFGPPGHPVATPPGLSARLADAVLSGIAPH